MNKILVAAAMAALTAVVSPASAQDFPDKPMRVIVAYPAGGGVDFVGRTLAQRLSAMWGQPVTVENKSGASGSIGADYVSKAKPDGLTLLLASPAEVLVGPLAGQKTPYDAQKALVPVSLVGETPLAIVAHPSLPVQDLAQLLAHAKKEPTLSYATPGSGSSMHFAGEALNHTWGTTITHVPYRGAAPAVNDVLGNQVPLGIVGLPPIVAHAKSGKMKVLAVTTAKRSPALPDVPTVSELPSLKDYQFSNWMMLLAPTGTPSAVIDKIAADVARVVQEPEIRKRLQEGGVEPAGLRGADLAKFIDQERVRYTAVAKARNVRYAE